MKKKQKRNGKINIERHLEAHREKEEGEAFKSLMVNSMITIPSSSYCLRTERKEKQVSRKKRELMLHYSIA